MPEKKFPGEDITPLDEFPRRSAHLSGWPEPVHLALDELVELADVAGVKSSRTEMAAALVMQALLVHREDNTLDGLLAKHRNIKITYIKPGE